MTEPHIPSARGAVDLSAVAQAASNTAQNEGQAGASWCIELTEANFQQFVSLSAQVPVLISLGVPRVQASVQLDASLRRLVDTRGGAFALGLVDAEAQQGIVQAFQAQQVPLTVALVKGQPVPLFQGPASDEQISQVLDQLLELAAQQGMPGGTIPPLGQGEAAAEAELPPLHQKAIDAIDEGDYAAAEAAYLQALNEKPNDHEAQVGVYQVRLLSRTANLDLNEARAAAAANPQDITAQLNVADLDVVGGHVEDAFARLVSLIATLADDDRERVRRRLIELYAVVGNSDERVAASRQKLARVLF
ncbi:tetratricopeptide repeat protein [Glutamicibacter endophyticus]